MQTCPWNRSYKHVSLFQPKESLCSRTIGNGRCVLSSVYSLRHNQFSVRLWLIWLGVSGYGKVETVDGDGESQLPSTAGSVQFASCYWSGISMMIWWHATLIGKCNAHVQNHIPYPVLGVSAKPSQLLSRSFRVQKTEKDAVGLDKLSYRLQLSLDSEQRLSLVSLDNSDSNIDYLVMDFTMPDIMYTRREGGKKEEEKLG